MPSAWPGANISAENDASQQGRKLSSPKLPTPLDISAKNLTSTPPEKSGSVSSACSNLDKIGHSNEKCNESVVKNNNSSNHNNDLNTSGNGNVKGNIVPRGSVTSLGAVLAATTLAASAASTEVATQLISPNTSTRRKNSKKTVNQSSASGKYGILTILYM